MRIGYLVRFGNTYPEDYKQINWGRSLSIVECIVTYWSPLYKTGLQES